ncbi:alpha-glucosidase (family GH31 glycosyl hydrolase) [Bacillus pakistanensis]|uniref:Alpha-glucosidase (Family GH31 glycosyl hydrolase) n=1 Tax=Rossellomorea pakistanensis TaxID=992288 RepID=A0ABS2NJA4_9BACI|nr:TIM-barrel domain-containing protein [Bacillus pakistanensis]MBM7587913.1 alpha-glucosidase (family GH31 glycosyl hydrolase) [Bacillus pakistanensis]
MGLTMKKGFMFLVICTLIFSGFGPSTFHTEAKTTSKKTSSVPENSEVIGDITDFSVEGNTYTISAGEAKVRVIFYKDDLFRIWLAQDGKFTDPAGDSIVVKKEFGKVTTKWTDEGDYYAIKSKDVVLRVYKKPLKFALYEADNQTLVWEESQGLSWTENQTYQSLKQGEEEQYFGGGMQNGRFSHRGETISISANYNWNDGGNPNAAPFYMSNAGYGVFRNTFAPGSYSFLNTVTSTHNENRFDAFYFHGPNLKQIINGYTELTGRPIMPPVYGLEMGDADCYNKDGQITLDALKVADGYIENDMPVGWMLVNDGYGCGYTGLKDVSKELMDRNITLGLWTEDGVANQEWEVGEAGVRVRKLDVAWVGPGYKFALDAAKEAFEGIEKYSSARGFVWMVEGWAGAQRHAVMWTGDQSGSWENIRFHIPTIMGSGLSGQAFTTGDIDGIFGGSAKTYVRDLQWKAFLPIIMSMSGWAAKDKQPWVYGEPYTSINRKYLKLREQLLPYIYTLSAEAHKTGVPPVRATVLEYPNDPKTWDETTKYQFLLGESFLVAPVYKDEEERDGIYLPKGTWVDYWTGDVYKGPRIINDYPAPLDTLPLFVKAGANIPMWPEMNSFREKEKNPLTFDIYPNGTSEFTLYEDDGVTREYKDGAYATQTIKTTAPENGRGNVSIAVGPSVGDYDGKLENREYIFSVHTSKKPANVGIGKGKKLKQYPSIEEWEQAKEGWYYDKEDRNGIAYVKTSSLPTEEGFTVTLYGTGSVGHNPPNKLDPPVYGEVEVDGDVYPDTQTKVKTTFVNADSSAVKNVNLSLNIPEGWEILDTTNESHSKVAAGESATTTFIVQAPEGTKEGNYELSLKATYEQRGEHYSFTQPKEVFVVDPYKIPQSEMTASATSEQSGSDPARNAIDGNVNSMWHTAWSGADKLPQSITINLNDTYNINKFTYLPRQAGSNGFITQYKLYVSEDGLEYTEVSSDKWTADKLEKTINFDSVNAQYVKFEAIEGNGGFASAAELNVFKSSLE